MRRERARDHYLSVVHWQPLQPPLFATPLLYAPTCDPRKFIDYRPNSLESSLPSNVIGDLDVDSAFPLIDPSAYTAPPAVANGKLQISAEDAMLLPDTMVQRDPQLRKLLDQASAKARAMRAKPWLRHTEYTEMPDPQRARAQLQRKLQQTFERPLVETASSFVATAAEDESMAAGVERTFRLAMELDTEFQFQQAGATPGPGDRLIHPDPSKRGVKPVEVVPLLPDLRGWTNELAAVHFLDGNPTPVERLVPPTQDFYALPPGRQRELLLQAKDYQGALLLQLQDAEQAEPAVSYLMKRRRPTDDDDDDHCLTMSEDEFDDDGNRVRANRRTSKQQAKRRRQSVEYERVADFLLVKESRNNARKQELAFRMVKASACYYQVLQYVPLRKRPVRRTATASHQGFVIEPRPMTSEEVGLRYERLRLLQPSSAELDEEIKNEVKAEPEVLGEAGEQAEEGEADAPHEFAENAVDQLREEIEMLAGAADQGYEDEDDAPQYDEVVQVVVKEEERREEYREEAEPRGEAQEWAAPTPVGSEEASQFRTQVLDELAQELAQEAAENAAGRERGGTSRTFAFPQPKAEPEPENAAREEPLQERQPAQVSASVKAEPEPVHAQADPAPQVPAASSGVSLVKAEPEAVAAAEPQQEPQPELPQPALPQQQDGPQPKAEPINQ